MTDLSRSREDLGGESSDEVCQNETGCIKESVGKDGFPDRLTPNDDQSQTEAEDSGERDPSPTLRQMAKAEHGGGYDNRRDLAFRSGKPARQNRCQPCQHSRPPQFFPHASEQK